MFNFVIKSARKSLASIDLRLGIEPNIKIQQRQKA